MKELSSIRQSSRPASFPQVGVRRGMERGTFNEVGFLSGDVDGWGAANRRKHNAWFDLASDVNRESMRILWRAAPKRPNQNQLIAALLFGRAMQTFQACVRLSAGGMAADARTLVRSVTESAIALAGIAHDPAFVNELEAAHYRHVQAMANSLLNNANAVAELSAEQVESVRKTLAEIAAKYPDGRPAPVNWESVAQRVGMEDIYLTVYRSTSGDGAHVSMESLVRHVEADSDNEIENLRFHPSDEDLAWTMSYAISAVFCAAEALGRVFNDESMSESLRSHVEHWRSLEITTSAKGNA